MNLFFVNDKITASYQTNISPNSLNKAIKTTAANFERLWKCNKRKSLLAFNNNTTNQIRMKIYCSRRAWYLK